MMIVCYAAADWLAVQVVVVPSRLRHRLLAGRNISAADRADYL